jgi:hypothetical protein
MLPTENSYYNNIILIFNLQFNSFNISHVFSYDLFISSQHK